MINCTTYKLFYLGLFTSLFFVGCADKGMTDLEQYVNEIKAIENLHVDEIPEYQHIPPYFYAVQDMRNPFLPIINNARNPNLIDFLGNNNATDDDPDACSHHPNVNRVRVGLELLPLDALEMVGMLEMDGIKWALIVSNERMIYRARQGDYIGENDGKIVDISEEQIDIMELLPDGKGCWTYELTSIRAFSK